MSCFQKTQYTRTAFVDKRLNVFIMICIYYS